jgi:hypothetical protein
MAQTLQVEVPDPLLNSVMKACSPLPAGGEKRGRKKRLAGSRRSPTAAERVELDRAG